MKRVFRDIGPKVETPNKAKRYYRGVCSLEEQLVLHESTIAAEAKDAGEFIAL